MKRETVGAMAILEVVGGDRGYRISFTCPQNQDEEGARGTNRKVVVLLGPIFVTAFVAYLSLAQRIRIWIQGTPRVQREFLIVTMYVQKKQS